MKIFDTFLYNGEKDLLRIRCEEMKDLNVTHILVQGDITFSGKPKDKSLTFNMSEFTNFRILPWIIALDPSENVSTWDRERYLRNSIKDCGLHAEQMGMAPFEPYDIVIISDIDEIPKASAIKDWNGEYAALMMDKFGFWLNCEEQHQGWHRARIMRYSYLYGRTPDEIRNSGFPEQIDNAGWHWSWLGGIDEVMRKFASFSHQESDVQKHANREELERKIKIGESIWSDHPWMIVPINDSFPKYIQDHQNDTLKHLIWNQ